MKTAMGSGIDFMQGSHEWHGIAPNDEQLEKHWHNYRKRWETTKYF